MADSKILHCHVCGHEWQWEPEDGDGPQDCPRCDDRARGMGHCKCGGDVAEPHTCPYQSEINDNEDFQCTCCSDCAYQCALDI